MTKKFRFLTLVTFILTLTLLFSCGENKSNSSDTDNDLTTTEIADTTIPEETQKPAEVLKENKITDALPTYDGGKAARSLYNCGTGIGGDASKSDMRIISKTTAEQFSAYLGKLEDAGFAEISRNEEFDNIYVQYFSEASGKLVYAYYIGSLGEARIIEDNASVPETEFEYTCDSGDVTVYQYAFMQCSDFSTNEYEINGMFFIIRLADNRLVCIDGANAHKQATVTATEALWNFMKEVTKSDEINIACWFISHPHTDHYGFLQQLLWNIDTYPVNIERVMFNIPESSVAGSISNVINAVNNAFPDVSYIKPHTGQIITLGNMDIEVMYTHEDYVNEAGATQIVAENNSSTVLKLHFNGRTMMLSGDWGGSPDISEDYPIGIESMKAMHISADGENSLKCDILQLSHHALNDYMSEFNLAVDPDYIFVPAPDDNLDTRIHPVVGQSVRPILEAGCDPEHVYFTNRYTYALNIATDSTITVAAEVIRGTDTGDDPKTRWIEEDYLGFTLNRFEAYRVPTDEEFDNWSKIHK